MSLNLTLVLLAASLAGLVFCGWRGARPPMAGRVRMAPWRFMMLLCAAAIPLLLVHLLALARGGPAA